MTILGEVTSKASILLEVALKGGRELQSFLHNPKLADFSIETLRSKILAAIFLLDRFAKEGSNYIKPLTGLLKNRGYIIPVHLHHNKHTGLVTTLREMANLMEFLKSKQGKEPTDFYLKELFLNLTTAITSMSTGINIYRKILQELNAWVEENPYTHSRDEPLHPVEMVHFEQKSDNCSRLLRWFRDLLFNISRHSVTKLHVADKLNKAKVEWTFSVIQDLYTDIENLLQEHRVAINLEKKAMSESYTYILDKLAEIYPFFDWEASVFVVLARRFSIWRKPCVVLNTEEPVTFRYKMVDNLDEVQSMWPPNQNFIHFVREGGAANTLRVVLRDFFSPLQDQVSQLEDEFKEDIANIKEAVQLFQVDLASFEKEMSIDSSFIK